MIGGDQLMSDNPTWTLDRDHAEWCAIAEGGYCNCDPNAPHPESKEAPDDVDVAMQGR